MTREEIINKYLKEHRHDVLLNPYAGLLDFAKYLDEHSELPEGLDAEIARYLREKCSSDNEPSVSEIARHFAEWGAEHLLSFLDTLQEQPGEELDKDRLLEVLDKWEEHAIRGMRNGATAYHQGKIALITDLRDWINGED